MRVKFYKGQICYSLYNSNKIKFQIGKLLLNVVRTNNSGSG